MILRKLKKLISVSIDTVKYDNVETVDITDGQVIINGKVQNQTIGHTVHVAVKGDVSVIKNGSGNITVVGNSGAITTGSGDVSVNGNVDGSIRTGSGDVECGKVTGNIKTGSGDINCG